MNHLRHCFEFACQQGLFDPRFYMSKYELTFSSDLEAFADYVRKSSLAPIAGSNTSIDCMSYRECYADHLHAGNGIISPIEDYFIHQDARQGARLIDHTPEHYYSPKTIISPRALTSFSESIAINLHIFYPDLFQKFRYLLDDFPYKFDLYISVRDDAAAAEAYQIFYDIPNCGRVVTAVNPNKGRNFRSLLVDFREAISSYDYIIHLHGKKSLYTGSPQSGWLDYLLEFILTDKQILCKTLSIFANNPDAGLYYPVFSQYFNPPWVSHTLKNSQLIPKLLTTLKIPDLQDIPINRFLKYPVGSMFIARRQAIAPLLSHPWGLDDFPDEPIPNDGTILHALERCIDSIADHAGFFSFQYHPFSGAFTSEDSHIYQSYFYYLWPERLSSIDATRKTLSFDIFDTLVTRINGYNDQAKAIVGAKLLGLDPDYFVGLRNDAELNLRIEAGFSGDVDIYQIYDHLARLIKLDRPSAFYADMEFAFDLELLIEKSLLSNFAKKLSKGSADIYYISDMYYTKKQISTILSRFSLPYTTSNVLVSSDLRARKDTGQMWKAFSSILEARSINPWCEHVHFGDNVCSDIQNCGDEGIFSYHILSPHDYMDYRSRLKDRSFEVAAGMNSQSELLGCAATILSLNPVIP